MKRRSTAPASKGIVARIALAAFISVSGTIGILSLDAKPAIADQYDAQIKALEREIEGYQAEAAKLSAQSETLENKLASLAAEKATVQKQIDLSQAKYDKLVADIAATEQRIVDGKDALGEIIADMYIEDESSPLEILASSTSISDFIDQQEYRAAIQEGLSSTIKEIKALKKQLETQKADVGRVLADQKEQRSVLASKENEQAQLLSATRGQEAAYQSLMKDRKSQISELREQQRLANIALGGSNVVAGDSSRGGYPNVWARAPQDSLVDNWGMYNRECVSYTAWKVYQSGKYMPYWGGRGNANQWPSSARADGIPTGSTPRVGSVAISMSGPYGHAMWVEAVSGDGSQIYVSQYNYYFNGFGNYSEMWLSVRGLTFIYF